MLELLIKGGPVMIPILLGSVAGVAIILERFWIFRACGMSAMRALAQRIFKLAKDGKTAEALEVCAQHPRSPLAALLRVGLERKSLPLNRLEKILEQVGNNQVQKLEKRLGTLASIISIEPLLGFLGTITGLIRAFMSWEQAGANVTVNSLALGIYEAMITTAAGLIVAVPLFLCYNYFISRIKGIANDLTNHAIQLTELLAEDNTPRGGDGA
jgi:biopolymer transport protein ExbB